MIVSLVGYRATGKSTIGRLLAQAIELPFFDADEVITQKIKRTIADIFQDEGEQGFRKFESQIVIELMNSSDAVIAWGGGVVLSEANREAISESDDVIWLKASADTVIERISRDENSPENRPALTDLDAQEEVRQLLSFRDPLYQSIADYSIETDHKSTDQIMQELVGLISTKK